MARKRAVRAEDLYRLELVAGMDLSRDGKRVAYAVQRVDRKTENKIFCNIQNNYLQLWLQLHHFRRDM